MKKRILIPAILMALFFFSGVSVQPVAAYGGGHTYGDLRAIQILNATFGSDMAELYRHLPEIDDGNVWADNDVDNPDRKRHYHNPNSHKGLIWLPDGDRTAATVANIGMERALTAYEDYETNGNILSLYEAYEWIGFALHHIQDLTTPCHTDIIDGGVLYHKSYESFCSDNFATYADPVTTGIYTFTSFVENDKTHCDPTTAYGWVDYAAHQANEYCNDALAGQFTECASALIPLSVKLSVGFLFFAFHQLHPDADVDGDGLTYEEEEQAGTYAWKADSDDDTMPDKWELDWGLNPMSASDKTLDKDGDGLKNYLEYRYGCYPSISDSDGDTMKDGWEITYGLNPLSSGDKYLDKDGDGLKNYLEYSKGTNPTKKDTDGDGLNDYVEIYTYHTNPTRFDTDGDGYGDGWEIANGYDPLNYYSKPLPPTDPIFVP